MAFSAKDKQAFSALANKAKGYGFQKVSLPGLRQMNTTKATSQPQGSFMSNVGKSIGNIAKGVGGFLSDNIARPLRSASDIIASDLSLNARIKASGELNRNNARALRVYTRQLAQGKISKDRYKRLVKSLTNDVDVSTPGLGERAKTGAEVAGIIATVGAPGVGSLAARIGGTGKLAQSTRLLLSGVDEGLGVGKTLGKSTLGKAVLAGPGKVVRNAVVQQDIKAVSQLPGQIKRGEMGKAGLTAATLAAPIAISAGSRLLPKVGKAFVQAVHGKSDGPIIGTFGKALDKIDDITRSALKEAESFTLDQQAVKNGANPVEWFKTYIKDTLKLDPEKLTPEEFAQRWNQFAKPTKKLQKLRESGKAVLKDGSTPVLSADFRKALPKIAQSLKDNVDEFGNVQRRADLVKDTVAKLGLENPTVESQLIDAISNARSIDDIDNVLANFATKVEVKVPGFRAPKGFIVTRGPKQVARIADVPDELQAGKQALPGLRTVGKILEKAGVGLKEQDTQIFTKFENNFGKEAEAIGLDGKQVLRDLSRFSENATAETLKRRPFLFGAYDERQLGVGEIAEALGVTRTTAKQVRKALFKSYNQMSFGELGLAAKIQNRLWQNVPGARTYSRIQGTLRYSLNPFFRLQEAIEPSALGGGIFGSSASDGILAQIFRGKKLEKMENAVDILKSKGVLRGIGFGREGSAETLGRITARATRTQELTIAGILDDMASKRGMKLAEFIDEAGEEAIDAVRALVQYPRSGFTSSNAAKMLNLAIFPARYNVKVATLAAKALANQPAIVQVATVKGIMDMREWLKSDEGVKWQADNSEVIGLFKYFTPINNVNQVLKVLDVALGEEKSVSDFGLIGGLPFGFITQILDSQGVIDIDPPYLNPKTGEIVPERVPKNLSGAAKLALIDFINTMYTFPGRQAGFSVSKRQLTEGLPGLKLSDKEASFEVRGKLTPEQERRQRILKGGKSQPKPTSIIPTLPKVPKAPKPNLPAKGSIKTASKKTRRQRIKTVPTRLRID